MAKRGETQKAVDKHNLQPVSGQIIWKVPPVGSENVIEQEESNDDHSKLEINNIQPLSDDKPLCYLSKEVSKQKSWKKPPVGMDITVEGEKSKESDSNFRNTNEPLSDDELSLGSLKRILQKSPTIGIDCTGKEEISDDSDSTKKSREANEQSFDNKETYVCFPCAVPLCKKVRLKHTDDYECLI